MLRSRRYLGLPVLAATIGLPVSAVADAFLTPGQLPAGDLHPPSPRAALGQIIPAGESRRGVRLRGGDDVEQAGYRKRAGYLKQAAVRR